MVAEIPFHLIPWESIPREEHTGITGTSFWRVHQLEGLRIRKVEYLPGYLADHWCSKGHIVFCLKGSFINELSTGERTELREGMTYVVSDDKSSHRSFTETGAELLIIDGAFLSSRVNQ